MSNLEKIAALEKTMLTPADVAEYLESDAESIRLQARANAAALGFPVIVMGNRVKIPKEGFIRFCRGDCYVGSRNAE